MRILAIRGQNLTSLAGAFEVDFEAEPLASAGIFAITGPTGAGKSTLLDAMCLALFNEVPRLASARSGQVGVAGGETLSAGDPRALLRHRAGEGFAEVDFVGLDHGRYRARWYVKRARQRSDGALQLVVQTFTNLETGEALGGTRTETLNAIRDKVGLTALQFGRAVMLAQGDFNAFIDADANARAELLEKLTGTDLYARLGIAARQKADRIRETLSEIEIRIAAQNGLDDLQRKAAEDRVTEARAAHETARALLAAREQDHGWFARAADLADRVATADKALIAATLNKTEAQPRQDALAKRRLAYSAVPCWRAWVDAEAKVSASLLRIDNLARDLGAADAQSEAAGRKDLEAAEALRLAAEELERQRPDIEAARSQDRRIAELDVAMTQFGKRRIEASADAEASSTRHIAALKKHDDAIRARGVIVDWLELNNARGSLAARREDLAADLVEHLELSDRVSELRRTTATLAGQLSEVRTTRATAEKAAAEAREALARIEQECAAAHAATPKSTEVEAIELARDHLTGVEPQLLAVERADAEHDRVLGAVQADIAERSRLDDVLGRCRTRIDEIDAELTHLQPRLDEAKRAGALSAAASGDAAEQLRSSLVAGQPCPVCGGTDHAIEALARLIDGRAAIDVERISEISSRLEGLGRERAVLTDRSQQEGARLTATADRLVLLETSLATAEEQSSRCHVALIQALQSCGIQASGIPAVRTEVAARLGAIDAQRRHFASAREAAQRSDLALEAGRVAFASASEQDRKSAQTLRELEVEVSLNADRLSEASRRLSHVASTLETSLAPHFDWSEDAAAVQTLDRIIAEWRSQTATLAALDGELPQLTKELHDADVERGRDAALVDAAIHAEQACLSERETFASKRQLILDGEPADTVATRLGDAVRIASLQREEARAACEAARSHAAAAKASHAQALSTLGIEEADAAVRRQSLEAELAEKHTDIELVTTVSAEGEATLDAEAAALAALERAVAVAEAELRSRAADRDAHAATPTPPIALEELDEVLASARGAEAAAREALGEAEMTIRQDDRARAATAALRATLEQQRAAAQPWFQLDVLIGDATGNKFRKYAQGLTLERLLLHANERLGELKPRYSLERAPGGDMLVQVVDNDMAGEIRGLPNLSGGERFLVSLALALGLSEMSTGQGLRVESLFIDEGFGALDSASLGQAIGVLEQLHATGRRVGVISHIEDVKDRISVKIVVTPSSNGSSAIEVQGG